MKTIVQLTNVEKAKLLHQLFPSEIPAFLEFVQGVSATIRENEQHERERWEPGLLTFDFWLSLVNDAERLINKYGKQLHKSHHLFADQLFDGYLSMFMAHCLIVYTTTRVHPNRKFSVAVDLLFNA